MNDKSDDAGTKWRLDKHIPIALLLAIGMQTAIAIWWAASVSASVAAIQARVDKLETNTALTIAQGNQLAAVDAKLTATQESIREVKSMVMGLLQSPLIPLQDKHHQ
jgi:hypothetical protein